MTFSPSIDSGANNIWIGGGTGLLAFCPGGSWEIKHPEGGNPEKGNLGGKASLALDYKRDKALVQVKDGDGFSYFLWDLKTNQRKSWTPQFPNTFGKQREVEGNIALKGNLIAVLTKDSLGAYHLWGIDSYESHHFMELPSLIRPFLQLPRPTGSMIGSLLSISPDGRWIVMLTGFIPCMGAPYFIVDRRQGGRYVEVWPEHFSAPLKYIFWSPDSCHLLMSSEMMDGSGRSFLLNLPPTKREQLNELAFWVNNDWLLLYHTAPSVKARLLDITSGKETRVDLSGYTVILDVFPEE
ncbi:MAG: hypothetical protein NTV14_03865 [Coprothermobacterota bacterium]|nr:hypothetical protein [Coprothermobacterota bacterium]